MNSIILLNLALLSYLPTLQSFSYLMTCSKFPSMGLNTNLGNMGTADSAYSTNQIMINGAVVAGSTGTYTPGSTITVSLSPYSGQLVFQATSGAVFQGAAGGNNVNGLLTSGCTAVSRYQMYTETAASLKMPASGTVKIECNFASSSGSGATKVTRPIVLTPVATVVSTVKPSLKPVVASAIQPSLKPIVAPTMTVNTPTSMPGTITYAPTQTFNLFSTRRPVKRSTRKPLNQMSTKKPIKQKHGDDDEEHENGDGSRHQQTVATSGSSGSHSSTTSDGEYVGIAIGIVAVSAILLYALFWYYKNYKKNINAIELNVQNENNVHSETL